MVFTCQNMPVNAFQQAHSAFSYSGCFQIVNGTQCLRFPTHILSSAGTGVSLLAAPMKDQTHKSAKPAHVKNRLIFCSNIHDESLLVNPWCETGTTMDELLREKKKMKKWLHDVIGQPHIRQRVSSGPQWHVWTFSSQKLKHVTVDQITPIHLELVMVKSCWSLNGFCHREPNYSPQSHMVRSHAKELSERQMKRKHGDYP